VGLVFVGPYNGLRNLLPCRIGGITRMHLDAVFPGANSTDGSNNISTSTQIDSTASQLQVVFFQLNTSMRK
jgi:hypothetical protein